MIKIDNKGFFADVKRWEKMYFFSLNAKSISNGTIKLYERTLRDFYLFIDEFYPDCKLSDINKHIMTHWVNYLLNEIELKKSTIKTKITIIKSFFLYITEENEDQIDFTENFKRIAIKATITEKVGYLSTDITKILNSLERSKNINNKKEINPNIKSFYFKLIYYTGIRVSELLNIKLVDIVFKDSEDDTLKYLSIKILGKGNKERIVYISYCNISDEYEYIKKYREYDQYICLTKNNKQYGRKELHSMFESIFKKAGVRFKGLHELRHTFARNLVSKNINLKTIQELLGHSDIQTTAKIYANTNESNKMAAIL